MSFYDIVMLVVLIGSIGFGFWKGFAWQIAWVAAMVVSYVVAINFREPVAQYIQAGEPWNKIGAMLILFVGCSLGIWLIYAWVTKSMEKMELKGFDRQIGALVGGVTGVLVCMAITMFSVSLMGDQAHEAIHDSKLGPYVVQGIQQVHGILPPEIAARFDDYVRHFDDGSGIPGQVPPTGYDLFQMRQADGSTQSNTGYQGGWQGSSFDNNYYRSSQPVQTQLNSQTTTGNANSSPVNVSITPPRVQDGGWKPPEVNIKVDHESLFKNLGGGKN